VYDSFFGVFLSFSFFQHLHLSFVAFTDKEISVLRGKVTPVLTQYFSVSLNREHTDAACAASADVNQTGPGGESVPDDVAGLKGSAVNHNLVNSSAAPPDEQPTTAPVSHSSDASQPPRPRKHVLLLFVGRKDACTCILLCPRPTGHLGIARSVRLSVPWRSCLGCRYAGCLPLSHRRRRPPEVCGLRTRPQTDVDPPRFLPPSNCHRRGYIVSPPPGRYLVTDAEWSMCPLTVGH